MYTLLVKLVFRRDNYVGRRPLKMRCRQRGKAAIAGATAAGEFILARVKTSYRRKQLFLMTSFNIDKIGILRAKKAKRNS